MKLDLPCLIRQFAGAAEEETVSTRDCNPYLLECVLLPLIKGTTLRLRDVDYSRFESEDIPSLVDYYEELERQEQRLEQFVGAVASIKPLASRVRQFC